jgi:hypothetical protein
VGKLNQSISMINVETFAMIAEIRSLEKAIPETLQRETPFPVRSYIANSPQSDHPKVSHI